MQRKLLLNTFVQLAIGVVGLASVLGGCESSHGGADGCPTCEPATKVGPVCPSCDEHEGGDTGDFGGGVPSCDALVSKQVDPSQAQAFGFDLSELERRLAGPHELPLHWKETFYPDAERRGGERATGFEPETRLAVAFSEIRALHHLLPDPALCDGTTCRLPDGRTEQQSNCTTRLEVQLEAELETRDGAVSGTVTGTVVMIDPEHSGLPAGTSLEPYFNLNADLAKVMGTLRLAPKAGGLKYEGTLYFTGRLPADHLSSDLGAKVLIRNGNGTVTNYWPLFGTTVLSGGS